MALIGLWLSKVDRWWIFLIIGLSLSLLWIIYRRILLTYYIRKLWNAMRLHDYFSTIRRLWSRESDRF